MLRGLRCASDDRSECYLVDATMQATVDRHRWAQRTVTETEHLVDFDVEAGRHLGCLGEQSVGAAGLARFGTAHLHDGPAGRCRAEILVEADDPVHLGDRLVEHIGQHRDRVVIDVAVCVLQRMQCRHEPTGPLAERPHERVDLGWGRYDIHGPDRTA